MACVYRHIRTDLNIPFYIGIGKEVTRAYSKTHRNDHWNHIVDKTSYDVHILFDDVSYEFAKEKEREFIELYKRKEDGGILCNLTKGGDGALGIRHTEEARKKMGEPNKGKTISDWHRQRISESHTGKIVSEETKEKVSEKMSGENNHRYGVNASEETRKKMCESSKKGESNHASKLTSSDVLEIRRLSSEGMGQNKIAKLFGVAKFAIHSIVKGLTWKHV
jgi:predicted transcriptional regulator